MPEKIGFARSLVRTARNVRVRTRAGRYLERRPAFDVDLGRLDRVVSRITEGLYWHHRRSPIPDRFQVAVFSETASATLMPARANSNADRQSGPQQSPSLRRSWRDALLVCIYARPAIRSAWIYEFYEDVRFVALVVPAEDEERGNQAQQ